MLLVDGQSTVFGLIGAPAGTLVLVEKSLTPSGADGRGTIDMTSLRNLRRTTKAPKQLLDFTPMKVTCFYDPALIMAYNAILQFNQRISQRFSDGSAVSDYGWLDKITYHELKEGEDCLCDVEFVFSGVPMTGYQVNLASQGAFNPGNETMPLYMANVGSVAAFFALLGMNH